MLKLMTRLALVLIPALVILSPGCATHVSPAAQKQIQQVTDQSAVKVAQAKGAGDVKLQNAKSKNAVNAENGKNAPVLHPIAAINQEVKSFRPILFWVTLGSFLLWAIDFGLIAAVRIYFPASTKLSSCLGFFAMPLRWLAILSLVALLALPFLPIGFVVLACAISGLFCYELIKHKGNVPEAEKDTEQLLGIGAASGSAIATKAATPTAPSPLLAK